jgi:hypothetical protein
VGADGVLVDVGSADFELGSVANAVVGEASLPDGLGGGEAVGEASFDQAYGALEGDALRGEEEVNVIGHDDEGVEFVVAFGAVVLEGFEEELGVTVDLEEEGAVMGCAGDEVGAGAGGAVQDRHWVIVRAGTSGAKAPFVAGCMARLKPCP